MFLQGEEVFGGEARDLLKLFERSAFDIGDTAKMFEKALFLYWADAGKSVECRGEMALRSSLLVEGEGLAVGFVANRL